MKLKITIQGGSTIEIDGVEKFEVEKDAAPSIPYIPNIQIIPVPYMPIQPGTGGTGDYPRPYDITWTCGDDLRSSSFTVNGISV